MILCSNLQPQRIKDRTPTKRLYPKTTCSHGSLVSDQRYLIPDSRPLFEFCLLVRSPTLSCHTYDVVQQPTIFTNKSRCAPAMQTQNTDLKARLFFVTILSRRYLTPTSFVLHSDKQEKNRGKNNENSSNPPSHPSIPNRIKTTQ